MNFTASVAIGIAYLVSGFKLFLVLRSLLYMRSEDRKIEENFAPKAAIISPHFGWDRSTEKNVKRILEQNYAGEYEVFFVTHASKKTGHDASFPEIERLIEPYENAQILLARNIIDDSLPRSQKIENLRTAIEQLPDCVEVIAFVDADAEVDENWLTNLVKPLQREEIGATVGYRFYHPESSNLATLVEAVWVNFQISLQSNNRSTMIWGGSNAMLRQMLSDGKILERWENAAVEDHNITHAVRSTGKKIHLARNCCVITRTSHRRWSEVFEFTNRQFIMTFWMGHRVPWLMALSTLLPKAIALATAIPLFFFVDRSASLLFLMPFVEMQIYRLAMRAIPKSTSENSEINVQIMRSSFSSIISTFVVAVNVICSLFKNEILWGGVRYKILSAEKCEVLGRVPE